MCKHVSKISCVTTLRSHQNFYTKIATDSAYLPTFTSPKGETLSYTHLMGEACVQLDTFHCVLSRVFSLHCEPRPGFGWFKRKRFPAR